MPFVRCRFYEPDTGAPINGGCRKGAQCDFVHPTDEPWDNAPNPRTPYMPRNKSQTEGHRDRKASGDSGWSGRSNAGAWRDASPPRAGPSRSNVMPPPAAPRRHSETASASGWGDGPIAGSAWRDTDNSANEREATTATPSSTWTSSSTAVNGTWGSEAPITDSWGAPTGGGSDPAPAAERWGEPTDGGWVPQAAPAADSWKESSGGGWKNSGTSSTAGPSNPPPPRSPPRRPSAPTIVPTRPKPAAPAQHSPLQERPEDIIWPASKGKERESDGGRTPQFGMNTPQYGFTPRTPRSPNHSPERNARRPSGSDAMNSPTDYFSAAKETWKDTNAHRLSSWGVSISIAHAGPEHASTSTSKRNPFAFPEYTPAEKMDGVEPAVEEGAVPDVDMESEVDVLARPLDELPSDVSSKWKDYIRTLSQLLSYSTRLKKIEDERQKLKNLHLSTKLYQSASLEAVHSKLSKLEKDSDMEISHVKRYQNRLLDNLVRYPLEGLPALSDKDPWAEELRSVREYIDGIKAWIDSVLPSIDNVKETIRKAEDARHREEEENKRIEDERKKAAAEVEALAQKKAHDAKWQPISSTRKTVTEIDAQMADLQERIANMEFEFDELRKDAPAIKEAVDQRLVELGYRKAIEPVALSRMSVEDGEVPFEPPKPPKTNEELTDECERLEAELSRLNDVVARGLTQMEEMRTRNLTRSRSHYEVRLDTERLSEQLIQLSKAHEEHQKLSQQQDLEVAQIRAMLERFDAERPPPPPPPPTLDEIKTRVADAVLPEVRKSLQDSLVKIMQGVDRVWERQQAEYCEKLVPTIDTTMRIAQTVWQYTDRHADAFASNPLPAPLALPAVQSVQN